MYLYLCNLIIDIMTVVCYNLHRTINTEEMYDMLEVKFMKKVSINVKVGDKVLISGPYDKSIGVVDRITPTGIIQVSNSFCKFSFRPDGRERGAESYCGRTIQKLTQEMEQRFCQENFIQIVTRKIFDECTPFSYEQAKALNDLFNLGLTEETVRNSIMR